MLLTRPKTRKQPACALTEEWVNSTSSYINTTDYYSAIKNGTAPFAATRMDLSY